MPEMAFGWGMAGQFTASTSFTIATNGANATAGTALLQFPTLSAIQHGGGGPLMLYASASQNGASAALLTIQPVGGFSVGETIFNLPGSFAVGSGASNTGVLTSIVGAQAVYPHFWAVSVLASATAAMTGTVTVFFGALAHP